MRPRQKLFLAAGGEPVFTRLQKNERGEFEFKEVNDSRQVLPDCSTTDIQSLLEAGIDPKSVNTKIIPSSEIVIDMSVEEQPNTEEKGE